MKKKIKNINLRNIKKWVFKTKFNTIITLINIIGIVLGSIVVGIIPTLLLFAVIDFFVFLLNHFLNKGSISQKKKKKKIVLATLLSMFIAFLAGAIVFIAIIVIGAPSFDPDKLYSKEASVIYDANGEVIARLGSEQRIKITYDQLPQVLIDAIVATEDSRYFQHNGFDLFRFLKASATQLLRRGGGGASTITMQVAKNAYTSKTSSGWEGIKRKFTDIYLSIFKIEKTYTKEEILEFYVNSYYMGNGAYGVEQACRNYFGKSVTDINLSEAAIIAGLFKGGNAYDPYLYPENTEARRKVVLSLMTRHGYITEEEKNVAAKLTVDDLVGHATTNNDTTTNEYQSFVDTVVEEVESRTGNNPYVVPMSIYTSMDKEKQNYLNEIMNGKSYKWENDVVQSGITVMNTDTGAIVAVGASRNRTGAGTYNYATMIKRQIGSTAKPLYDYGPAIEYNNWSPAQPIVDEPFNYSGGGELHNWDARNQGYMTMRNALRVSRNVPALKTFQQLSNEKIKDFVTKLGLSPEVNDGFLHEAHSVGGYNGESPKTMAAAYAAFANGGTYIEPHSFDKIVYAENNEEYVVKPKTTKVMSDATAYMVTSMLEDTAAYTTGSNTVNGVAYANKTGTSNFNSETKKIYNLPANAVNDLWVAGYCRDYSIALWYGYDKIYSKYNNKMSSGQNTKLFKNVIKGIFSGTKSFTAPSSVAQVEIETDTATPLLPSAYTPSSLRKTELFKVGSEPTDVSNRFSQLENVKNLKATSSGSSITITWDGVNTPAGIDSNAIRKEFSSIFSNEGYLNSFVNSRISYNNSYIGSLGYNVYKKQSDGTLKLLGNTTNNTYTDTATSTNTTYVVKTAYTIFKDNMSSGVETTVSSTSTASVVTTQLNGEKSIVLSTGTPYTDVTNPVTVFDNMVDVTSKVTITKTNNIDYTKEGTYTVTYQISYDGYTDTLTRTVQYKNS